MITIKTSGNKLSITGHSSSQICASVSTITCMTYNLLCEFNELCYFNDDGVTMEFTFFDTETSNKIRDVALGCLKDLSNQYSNYVRFE